MNNVTNFKKIIFSVILVGAMLLVIEIAFRIMYSVKYRNPAYMTFGFKYILEYDISVFNGYMKLSESYYGEEPDRIYNGFRTNPFLIEKPKNEYRIVALGGSSTYGILGGYHNSWPYLLETKLKGRLEGYQCRVINAGIPAQTTYGVNRLLTSEVLEWNPDMIIIYSLINHVFYDTAAMNMWGEGPDKIFRFCNSLFGQRSLVMHYLLRRISLFLNPAMPSKQEAYRYLLTDSIEKCKQKGIEIIIVKQLLDPKFFPRSKSDAPVRDGNNFSPTQYYEFMDIIDGVCEELDCPVIDFSASSPVCKGRQDELLTDYVHLTSDGKDLLTDLIYEKIEEVIAINAVY